MTEKDFKKLKDRLERNECSICGEFFSKKNSWEDIEFDNIGYTAHGSYYVFFHNSCMRKRMGLK